MEDLSVMSTQRPKEEGTTFKWNMPRCRPRKLVQIAVLFLAIRSWANDLLTNDPMSVMRTNGSTESWGLLQRCHLLLLICSLSVCEKAALEMKLSVVKCWVLFLSQILPNKGSRKSRSTGLEFENQKL